MTEFFVRATSFAAPFFSDFSEKYVVGETPLDALQQFVTDYSHPCGLYAAAIFANADAYHKDEKPLARWLSNAAANRLGDTNNRLGDAKEGRFE